MTKEQFLIKWGDLSRPLKSDLNAVIAYEIEQAQEVKLKDAQFIPAPNPIREAYDAFKPIKRKDWNKYAWIKKHSEGQLISENGTIYNNCRIVFDFDENPQDWEIYEAEAEKVTDSKGFQGIGEKKCTSWGLSENPLAPEPAKPKFDQERFERMFRAVVASGRTESYDQDFLATNICLEQLDAYYASKKGGENG